MNIWDVIALHREQVRLADQAVVSELLKHWGQTSVELQAKFGEVTVSIETARMLKLPVSQTWLIRQARYQELLAMIDRRISTFGAKGSAVTNEAQSRAIIRGLGHAIEASKASGISVGLLSVNPTVPEAALAALGRAGPVARIFDRMGSDALELAQGTFFRALAEGKNPKEIARGLVGEIESLTRVRANLIAREETHRAYRVAGQESHRANRDVIKGLRFASARDGRVCPICLARDGMILGIDDPDPRHIGCRCSLIPISAYFEDLTQRANGEEWLGTLPKAEQIRRLGPARYELWSSGQIALKDLYVETNSATWGPGLKYRTLGQLRKIAA